jgi:vacuolar-type H+-ATPase subunit I/STV1
MSELAATATGPDTEAPAVERELAFDMVRRGIVVAPLLVLVAALIWGGDGAWSALVAVALVLVNLTLSAVSLSWAARVSLTMIMAVAFGGFAVRMGIVVAVIAVVRHEPWIDLTALAVGVLVTHLGLLFWELRYVSASLAFPGLKPVRAKEARTS